ncbi:MAG: YraN family protein [Butyrivibrio sp.]|nr:YraN family protein [Butyrivibrio sp.]
MNKRNMGSFYEDIAAKYIEDHGGRIIERNYRARQGEIDIIACDGEYLCFVEVKYRNKDKYGDALAAVNYVKQRKICKVSQVYIKCNGANFDIPIRYDVVAVNVSDDGRYTVNWVKNAFDYVF